jgi:quercetin dioxygenase-like cupin family protein
MIRIFDEELLVQLAGEGGTYAVVRASVAPGGGPPLHAHPNDETLFVLSGELMLTQQSNEEVSTFHAVPGSLIHAPAGVAHRFENVGHDRCEVLFLVVPELVGYFRDMAAKFPPGSAPDMETMLSINERHQVTTYHGEAGSRPEPPKDGATSSRARALAWQFEQANLELIDLLNGCPEARWQAICPDTGWTVTVQADHIAEYRLVFDAIIRGIVDGTPLAPTTFAAIDAQNAKHAIDAADLAGTAVLATLRDGIEAPAQTIRVLTDDDLQKSATTIAGHAPQRVEAIVELSIRHVIEHTAAIRTALNRA